LNFREKLERLILQPHPASELGIAYEFSFIIKRILLSSMDSDLDAFSHNPTDGSFTALASQPTVFTNYLR
jgi:hypothetical protein